uniref:Immunoglobulin subtype domain-containing protein n=1 Tax=Oncorhynchus kisutch TaxID=8019 RepID=A0A8C7CQ78_ONCKI
GPEGHVNITYAGGEEPYRTLVVTRKSSHLFGVLKTGDVSLTILNVTEKDSGQYGCRVHVYGLWNDEKYHVNLNIEKAPVPTTSQAPANVTITQQTMDNHTHCHVTTNSTEYSDTSTPLYSESILEQMTGQPVILVSILLVLTGVVIVSVLVVLNQSTLAAQSCTATQSPAWLCILERWRWRTSIK